MTAHPRPQGIRAGRQIVLNVGPDATNKPAIGNELVEFQGFWRRCRPGAWCPSSRSPPSTPGKTAPAWPSKSVPTALCLAQLGHEPVPVPTARHRKVTSCRNRPAPDGGRPKLQRIKLMLPPAHRAGAGGGGGRKIFPALLICRDGTPVAESRWRKAMARETPTTCCYCGVGCGVIVTSDGGRITGVRGDPDHPANFGRIGTKGATLHSLTAPRSTPALSGTAAPAADPAGNRPGTTLWTTPPAVLLKSSAPTARIPSFLPFRPTAE